MHSALILSGRRGVLMGYEAEEVSDVQNQDKSKEQQIDMTIFGPS